MYAVNRRTKYKAIMPLLTNTRINDIREEDYAQEG